MICLILSIMLRWQNPCYEAMRDSCVASIIPLDDLEYVEIWGAERWGDIQHFATVDSRGKECQIDSLTIPLNSGTYWYIAVDDNGNRSCVTKGDVRPTVGVNLPIPIIREIEIRYYDISGRRILNPKRNGIYFTKKFRNNLLIEKGKIIIIR